MKTQLFIPDKIKVGFRNRDDTFTKKLAYVIYYDKKGVLRKQKSWDGWRDEKIDALDLDNTPHSGFVLNKDVHRGGEWFSVGRNHIRIYDDRGIEFEITPENLIYILMNTNCVKRSLEGEFVYAWDGKELVLLPVNAPEYVKADAFTALQGGKVKVKDLIPGCWYRNAKEEDYLYLGKFKFFWLRTYDGHTCRMSATEYVFLNKKDQAIPFKSLSSFRARLDDVPIDNFAEKLDTFLQSSHNGEVTGVEVTPWVDQLIPATQEELKKQYGADCYRSNSTQFYRWVPEGGGWACYCVYLKTTRAYDVRAHEDVYTAENWHFYQCGSLSLEPDGFRFTKRGTHNVYYVRDRSDPVYTGAITANTLCLVLEDGRKIPFEPQKYYNEYPR